MYTESLYLMNVEGKLYNKIVYKTELKIPVEEVIFLKESLDLMYFGGVSNNLAPFPSEVEKKKTITGYYRLGSFSKNMILMLEKFYYKE